MIVASRQLIEISHVMPLDLLRHVDFSYASFVSDKVVLLLPFAHRPHSVVNSYLVY